MSTPSRPTFFVDDTDSPRWFAFRGRDAGRVLREWGILAVRSPRNAGFVVRRHHIPDLIAHAEQQHFRLVDRRREVA